MPHRLIEENEKRLQAIVDNSGDGLITLDVNGNIRHFNKASEKIFGYKADEVIGRSVKLVIPEDIAIHQDGYMERYEGRREVSGRCKNGLRAPLEMTLSEIRMADNALLYSCILADTAPQKQLEAEREALIAQLAATNKDLELFASIVAHDLKSPLRAISQHLTLVEQVNRDKLDSASVASIRFAVEGAQRMKKLIDGLFEYTRVGFRDTNCEVVDCGEMLSLICKNLETEIGEKRAKISCDPLPQIQGDRVQIQQLLQNLVGNALKYCESEPRVHVSARPQDGMWELSVWDNGIGIAPQQQERIFRIFCRLNTEPHYADGIGLGLAICDRVVKNHKGRIWVEAAPGNGSVFHFTLPSAAHVTEQRVAHG
jgi:PAS domain S-box-containing protein